MSIAHSIEEEMAGISEHQSHNDGYHTLTLHAPAIAREALPGQFVSIQCHPLLPLRRPMSIMSTDPHNGLVRILFRGGGGGTHQLTQRPTGEKLPVMGPVGRPFRSKGYRRRPLLIGGGVGIPPLIFLAQRMSAVADISPLALFGLSTKPFFSVIPSLKLIAGLPPEATGAVRLLEDWGISSRLACNESQPGCWHGYVTELAEHWLAHNELDDIEIYACGPEPMLAAVARLAKRYSLPAQIAVEEFMACFTGGCAGCAIPTYLNGQIQMQRVCVDGPVFEYAQIYP